MRMPIFWLMRLMNVCIDKGTISEMSDGPQGYSGIRDAAAGAISLGREAVSTSMHRISKFRLAVMAMIAVLPSFLLRPCYRLFFGYRIGKRVRIGFSILDAGQCTIEDDVQIGHLNIAMGVGKLTIGDHVHIGHLNIIRGGDEVQLGRYSELRRMTEIKSIHDPDIVT